MMLLPGAARTSIQQSFESRRTEFRNTVAQTVHDPCGRGPLDMTQENSHLNHLQHVGLGIYEHPILLPAFDRILSRCKPDTCQFSNFDHAYKDIQRREGVKQKAQVAIEQKHKVAKEL